MLLFSRNITLSFAYYVSLLELINKIMFHDIGLIYVMFLVTLRSTNCTKWLFRLEIIDIGTTSVLMPYVITSNV